MDAGVIIHPTEKKYKAKYGLLEETIRIPWSITDVI